MIERMSVMNRNRKLNRISKTVISGLLVTSLVVSNGAYANAQKISKDESVYVNADESGATTKITVSNWLKNAGINGTINDESDLKDIQNVKGDETFTQNGDDVQWSAGSNDIYYQGTTDKLPFLIPINQNPHRRSMVKNRKCIHRLSWQPESFFRMTNSVMWK